MQRDSTALVCHSAGRVPLGARMKLYAASRMAMSKRTFLSTSIPAFFKPCMKTLYDIPCWCAPALMRTIQSFRKSRFLFLRSRYAYFQPRSTVSLAAFHSLLRAPNAPRAAFITCFLRFKRATFDLTRGIYLLLYA